MKTGKIAHTFRVESGKHFRLKDFDPADTGHWKSKEHAEQALMEGIARTGRAARQAVCPGPMGATVNLSGNGCGGKRRRHQARDVGVNPQGCQVYSFKTPSDLELQHDFLWRTTRDLPERGPHRNF